MTMFNPETSGADRLISRVIDGSATESDWAAFRALADRDHSLWRELAEFQRDHGELTTQVHAAIAIADEVDAPAESEIGRRFSERMRLVATWGGWAAAAVVALMLYTGAGRTGAVKQNNAGLVNLDTTPPQDVINRLLQDGRLSSGDLFQNYLAAGHTNGSVVGEVPDRVLVTARRMKSGGYEVTFIRQIMERTRINEFRKLGTTDWGTSEPVPVELRQAIESGRY